MINFLTKSSGQIRDNEQHPSHILNIMMLSVLPFITMANIALIFVPHTSDFFGPFSSRALTASLIAIIVVYLMNRCGFYNWAMLLLYVYGSVIIILNATFATKPPIEILFLILLPLTAIAILKKWWQVVGITLVSFLNFMVFLIIHVQDFAFSIRDDLIILFVLQSVLILFVTYWNHIAEQQRLKLVVENEKAMLMKDLLSNISHDLKTPLSVIASNLYLLKNMPAEDRALRYIERAERQVWRLEKSILDVIIISRLDTINRPLNEDIDINMIVQNCLAELSGKLEKNNLHVEFNTTDNLPIIQGNQSDMIRMVENMLENAINYTQDGGKITVKLDCNSHHLSIAIADSGIGIASENIDKIFERFYRADRARSIATGGTGLGLAIVKEIVQMHGGTIAVNSQIDQGTRFTIQLPLAVTTQHQHM